MWFEFSKMSVSLNLRENQGSIKNIFDLLPPFLPFSSCFKCILYIISFIYLLYTLLYSISKLKMEKGMSHSIFQCEPKRALMCFS